jgi:hypothetical protein
MKKERARKGELRVEREEGGGSREGGENQLKHLLEAFEEEAWSFSHR